MKIRQDWIKLDEVIYRTSQRLCLLCNTNLDDDIGEGKWHIPLCKKHRVEEIDKQFSSLNSKNSAKAKTNKDSIATPDEKGNCFVDKDTVNEMVEHQKLKETPPK